MRNDDIANFNLIIIVGIVVEAFRIFNKFIIDFLLMLDGKQKLLSSSKKLLTEITYRTRMSELKRLIN